MPLTLSHPALVLPLRRWRWLSWPALVAGSMAPDLFYFAGPEGLSKPAHMALEGLCYSLPSAVVLLVVFTRTRSAWGELLPEPWRAQVLASPGRSHSWWWLAVSLTLGIWSHILWDNFTHSWGVFVRHFAPLRETWFQVGFYRFDGFRIAQHVSSLVGLLVLAAAAWPVGSFRLERQRALIWAAIAAVSLAAGLANGAASRTYSGVLQHFATAAISTAATLGMVAGWMLRRARRG